MDVEKAKFIVAFNSLTASAGDITVNDGIDIPNAIRLFNLALASCADGISVDEYNRYFGVYADIFAGNPKGVTWTELAENMEDLATACVQP